MSVKSMCLGGCGREIFGSGHEYCLSCWVDDKNNCRSKEDSPGFRDWLTSPDPFLGWPVMSWLLWTLCIGMFIGAMMWNLR